MRVKGKFINPLTKSRRRCLVCILFIVAVILPLSCETRRFRHDPPPGQGSLILDNRTGDRLHAYIDGYHVGNVSRYDYEIHDLDPGVYRVVIDERGGYRTWRGDVDVLEGQLTVLALMIDYSYHHYHARIYFE